MSERLVKPEDMCRLKVKGWKITAQAKIILSRRNLAELYQHQTN